MLRSTVRARWLLAALLFVSAACTDGGYELVVRFEPPDLASEVEAIEIALVTDCASQPLGEPAVDAEHAILLHRDEPLATLGTLEAGQYGLYGLGRSNSCGVVAAGCEEVSLEEGGSGTLGVTLRRATGSVCRVGTRCDAGACVPCTLGPFGAPVEVGVVSTTSSEGAPDVSADGLTLYWSSTGSSVGGGWDLWRATRPDRGSPFTGVENLTAINASADESGPEISVDGLTLYYNLGPTPATLWMASWNGETGTFQDPRALDALESPEEDRSPSVTADGLEMFYMSRRARSGNDLWVATRTDTASPFGDPQPLTTLNTSASESDPDVTPDGLTLYFDSNRTGTVGDSDLWMATRPDRSSPFGNVTHLGDINSADGDYSPSISADGRELFFASTRPGGTGSPDIWVARRDCL